MLSSATNFKLIVKPRSLALSYNCSPDIKEEIVFLREKNILASEKKIEQINLRRNPFKRLKSIVKMFGLSTFLQVNRSLVYQ